MSVSCCLQSLGRGEGGQESPQLLPKEAKEKQEQEQLTILENNNTLAKHPGLLQNGDKEERRI